MSTSPMNTAIESVLADLYASRHIPRATYRVQFSPDFTFRDAAALAPYLRDLGISDLYASPIFQARSGSTHGYDVCDYGALNDALGTLEDFAALVEALQAHGLRMVLDIVPNHMGVDTICNAWWRDVLENGPSSPYAAFFDIDWDPVKQELENKVLLPVLEDQYGMVLESGKIALAEQDGAFAILYGALRLPVTPDTYADILDAAASALAAALEPDDAALQELQSILTALRNLPPYTDTTPEHVAERIREKEITKRRIAALLSASPVVRAALDDVLTQFNGDAGDPESFDRLDALLSAQPYRMSFWRVATDEINYRRFFDINDMAAIHVEQPEVFRAVHARTFEMLAAGQASALRIDHPDGLWHPAAYFRALQAGYLAAAVRARLGSAAETLDPAAIDAAVAAYLDAHYPVGEHSEREWPLYIVAEKILSETEPLPLDWAVYGTTGYDVLNAINGLFVDGAQEDRFSAIYHGFIGHTIDFAELVYDAKHLIMEEALSSEIQALSHDLDRITEFSRRYRDFTRNGILQAIREVIASLSIYRTYITGPDAVSERDQYYILDAVLQARRRNPGTSRLLFSFIRDTLLLHNLHHFSAADQPKIVAFVMKFQQLTGPVMAKGVEDTSFYVYNRLTSLNEVGGHPEQFGTPPEVFHEQNQTHVALWPHTMLTLSTHDTKRSADVRARLNVLSELPDAWEAALTRWAGHNERHKTLVDDTLAPDRNDEYLYYQSLLGIWPDDLETPDDALHKRLTGYVTKAANEAKVHTSWINPDEDYLAALVGFVNRTLDDAAFVDDMRALQRRVAAFGRYNALAQMLLELTVPGVPDIYQGNELWDLSLVDPDNRRPVDFALRRHLLGEFDLAGADDDAQAGLAAGLVRTIEEGRIKLYTLATALRLRRDRPYLFEHTSYEPVEAAGERAEHVCAFVRRAGEQALLVAVPRLIAGLTAGEDRPPVGAELWGDTALTLPPEDAGRRYRNAFTGEVLATPADGPARLPLADVFRTFPVALFTRLD